MKRNLHFVFIVLLSGVLFGLTGCWFKKKQPAPPPQAQAPTLPPEPAPTPQEQPPAQPQPEQKPETAEAQPKPKPKPKPKKQAAHKPTPAPAKPEEKPQQQASVTPPRIVIQEGGADNGTGPISAVTGHDEAAHRRMSTAQLLNSTEANLRSLHRTLTADEQSTLAQIKDYMEQSRAATAQQDLVRAHNLALKAHLLSDDLVKK